jgi:hypothetical protein
MSMLRGDAGLAADEAISLERHDHLVNRRRTDAEVALHVSFGGRTAKHVRVGVDESQVLALLFGEAAVAGAARGA